MMGVFDRNIQRPPVAGQVIAVQQTLGKAVAASSRAVPCLKVLEILVWQLKIL